MNSITAIALSGLHAAESRLKAAASNIANSETTGGVPGSAGPSTVYLPIDVVQVSKGFGQQSGGVATSYAARSPGYTLVSDPNSPSADANGFVAAPAVDLATELAQTVVAKYQFAASAKVIEAANQMERTAIDTLA